MPHPATKVVQGKKTFIPLENNPEVFRRLASKLGLSPCLDFFDVLDVNDADLLAFIPRPVHAIIFLTPADVYHATRDGVEKQMEEYQGCGPSEPVMWFKQTIGHACGLMAFLHSVMNGAGKSCIPPGSQLDKILQTSIQLRPEARADLLYNSDFLEIAHMDAADTGDSTAPSPEDPNYFHFVAFVKADDGHLWELNGGMPGPLDHGLLEPDEDALSQKALYRTVRQFIGGHAPDVRHSIVALGPA
ncbi:ubiquitin carboxyl-terminal hydrolase L3 [Talaromyces islandicus]|uniref:Ubiquitin carboxyl-terminal hydrolase n=1 Tax=Talaromyces islandicus TaxID=28573 RepID=A0A0U1M0J8_TALIS|nr:ubiquitin carboxyl-terminal hydrolase L3 [Talaromyces islandicus]